MRKNKPLVSGPISQCKILKRLPKMVKDENKAPETNANFFISL